jgi:transmembrane sensor
MGTSGDREAIEEAAARWLVRREGGSWEDTDEAALNAWLDAATAHRIAFLENQAAWIEAGRMKALGAGVPAGVVPPRGQWGNVLFFKGASPESYPPNSELPNIEPLPINGLAPGAATSDPGPITPPDEPSAQSAPAHAFAECDTVRACKAGKTFHLSSRRVVAAACLALMLAAGAYFSATDLPSGGIYTTSIGGLDQVRLPDGSRVTLNTDTSIQVRMTDKERHIDLLKGEAFFEVAKDMAHPFVVYVGDKRVMAVGTKFSVRRDSDDVEVVVTEGKVKLASADNLDAVAVEGVTSAPMPAPALLYAGAVAKASRLGVLVRQDAQRDAERLVSWRTGYINFQDTELSAAAAEFNRYNVRKIVIADPAIEKIRVGGNFRSDNTDAFLALLQSRFPVAVEQESDRIVLRPR